MTIDYYSMREQLGETALSNDDMSDRLQKMPGTSQIAGLQEVMHLTPLLTDGSNYLGAPKNLFGKLTRDLPEYMPPEPAPMAPSPSYDAGAPKSPGFTGSS